MTYIVLEKKKKCINSSTENFIGNNNKRTFQINQNKKKIILVIVATPFTKSGYITLQIALLKKELLLGVALNFNGKEFIFVKCNKLRFVKEFDVLIITIFFTVLLYGNGTLYDDKVLRKQYQSFLSYPSFSPVLDI